MSWLIEPRDTLVLRDGRPMATGAVRSHTLPFPWPSSVAGLVRSALGSNRDEWAQLQRSVSVRGPWLVSLDAEGAAQQSYFPAPRDAVWFKLDPEEKTRLRRRRLAPTPADDAVTDLDGLQLVGLASKERAKPAPGPAFWSEKSLLRWLAKATDDECVTDDVGIGPLPRELRTHVALQPNRTGEDGMLFSTEHLRLADKGGRYGLRFDAEGAEGLRPGPVVLGGERRPSYLRKVAQHAIACPAIDPQSELLRVVLVTPAIFAEGAVPAEIRGARVVAAVVDRPEVISGWDFVVRAPKATRRMAPAGSVYWVAPKKGSAHEWAKEVWMDCVSTGEQDRRDGFGMALVGNA